MRADAPVFIPQSTLPNIVRSDGVVNPQKILTHNHNKDDDKEKKDDDDDDNDDDDDEGRSSNQSHVSSASKRRSINFSPPSYDFAGNATSRRQGRRRQRRRPCRRVGHDLAATDEAKDYDNGNNDGGTGTVKVDESRPCESNNGEKKERRRRPRRPPRRRGGGGGDDQPRRLHAEECDGERQHYLERNGRFRVGGKKDDKDRWKKKKKQQQQHQKEEVRNGLGDIHGKGRRRARQIPTTEGDGDANDDLRLDDRCVNPGSGCTLDTSGDGTKRSPTTVPDRDDEVASSSVSLPLALRIGVSPTSDWLGVAHRGQMMEEAREKERRRQEEEVSSSPSLSLLSSLKKERGDGTGGRGADGGKGGGDGPKLCTLTPTTTTTTAAAAAKTVPAAVHLNHERSTERDLSGGEKDTDGRRHGRHKDGHNIISSFAAIGADPSTATKPHFTSADASACKSGSGKLDLVKMRNRWWRVLKEKKKKDDEEEAASRVKVRRDVVDGGGGAREAAMPSSALADALTTLFSSMSSSGSSSSLSSSSSSVSTFGSTDSDDTYRNKRNNSSSSNNNVDGISPLASASAPPGRRISSNQRELEPFLGSEYPLHLAICKNNSSAVTKLLAMAPALNSLKFHAAVSLSQLGLTNRDCDTCDIETFAKIKNVPFKPLLLAVRLDQPNNVKALLDSALFAVDSTDESRRTPLMIASGLGLDGCVRVLLLYGPRLLAKDRVTGGTALHACCAGVGLGLSSTLRLLLSAAGRGRGGGSGGGGGGGGGLALQRLLCQRDDLSQTAMHVACVHGRTDLLEVMLSEGGAAGAAKAMHMEDEHGRTPLLSAVAAGAADCVMALLMWGGNRRRPVGPNGNSRFKAGARPMPTLSHSSSCLSPRPCPLTLAAASGSADMVRLLLEFGDGAAGGITSLSLSLSSSASFVGLNAALAAAIEAYFSNAGDDGEDMLDVIRLLAEAGADPHATVDYDGRFDGRGESPLLLGSRGEDCPPRTALSRAATMARTMTTSGGDRTGDDAAAADVLQVVLDSHASALSSKRIARRADPLLRRQPESYFARIEAEENSVVAASMQDALIRTLFLGWKDGSGDAYACAARCSRLAASLVLYRAGVRLSDSGLERLGRCMSKKVLQGSRDWTASLTRCFEATYVHYGISGCNERSQDSPFVDGRSGLGGWSAALTRLAWIWDGVSIEGEIICGWMRERLRSSKAQPKRKYRVETLLLADECYLVIEGKRLVAHKSIISAKSAKLAAAVRFASLNRSSHESDEENAKHDPIEIVVDAPIGMVKLLLQHCYHGSIVSGLSWSDPSLCCRQLFELALLADEFICPSLLVECEMRLLSGRPDKCVCWCCCSAIRHGGKSGNDVAADSDEVNTVACGHAVTCLYRMTGPSRLITPETAVDVVAMGQEPNGLSGDKSVGIKHKSVDRATSILPMNEKEIWRDFDAIDRLYETGPFAAAKAIAVEVLLRDFGTAMKSDSFLEQLQAVQEDVIGNGCAAASQNLFPILILEACLDELSRSQLQVLSPQKRTFSEDNGCQERA